MSPQELAAIIFRYIDMEKLHRENPFVTKEMILSFLNNISAVKSLGKTADTHKLSQNPQKSKQKEYTELIIHTDGASRGNPGMAGIGVAIFDKDYHVIDELCEFIGESTNNVAEYKAMILAAKKAVSYNANKVTFKTDSELLVRQLNNTYRVKNHGLLPLYKELMTLLGKISKWHVRHVRREENTCADTLANKGVDSESKSSKRL
ncbi:MAG: ribonuclease HI family protein [Candidatus Brocadiales bacterium]|nr:ribonuclease HI family protein [Candidatus Brocadiales bacterium]